MRAKVARRLRKAAYGTKVKYKYLKWLWKIGRIKKGVA